MDETSRTQLKETWMNEAGYSLRTVVEKWLSLCSEVQVWVVRFGRTRGLRYVRVEALLAERPVKLFLFRHNDGAWRVFPPEPSAVTMTGTSADEIA